MGVLETEGVGYLADAIGGRGEAVTGLSDEVLLDELLGTIARLGFHEVAEVVGREVQRIGKVAHGGHSLSGGEALGEIVIEQNVEALHQLAVDGFSRDELAVVEADAVVQNQGNVLRHQLSGVAVDAAFQLRLNVAEDVVQLLAFALRYVQGFVDGIAEEGVGRHRNALHQRRREDEHHTLVSFLHVTQLDVVVRGEEEQRAVVVVVLVAPVAHGAAACIFINHAVEAKCIAGIPERTTVGKVVEMDDLDERVAHVVTSEGMHECRYGGDMNGLTLHLGCKDKQKSLENLCYPSFSIFTLSNSC